METADHQLNTLWKASAPKTTLLKTLNCEIVYPLLNRTEDWKSYPVKRNNFPVETNK